MEREIFISDDGCASIFVPSLNEHYHSTCGAYQESKYVYINCGLQNKITKNQKVNILEIGLGTGLDVILSLFESEKSKTKIFYHGVEAYPLNKIEVEALNFADFFSDNRINNLMKIIHLSNHNESVNISENFTLFYDQTNIEKIILKDDFFDIVYFDAFSPGVQPELWTKDIFDKIYRSMRKSAILMTYCVKGSVRRTMKDCGFSVEKLPGIGTKREITRAIK